MIKATLIGENGVNMPFFIMEKSDNDIVINTGNQGDTMENPAVSDKPSNNVVTFGNNVVTTANKQGIMKKTGIELIAQERREQIEKHGRTVQDDVIFNWDGQLRIGAVRLIQDLNKAIPPEGWNVGLWNKMNKKPLKQRLIIAASLIAAEIDRLQAEEEEK